LQNDCHRTSVAGKLEKGKMLKMKWEEEMLYRTILGTEEERVLR
jgi:hypothetical protein